VKTWMLAAFGCCTCSRRSLMRHLSLICQNSGEKLLQEIVHWSHPSCKKFEATIRIYKSTDQLLTRELTQVRSLSTHKKQWLGTCCKYYLASYYKRM
jgi:hypothetical protein